MYWPIEWLNEEQIWLWEICRGCLNAFNAVEILVIPGYRHGVNTMIVINANYFTHLAEVTRWKWRFERISLTCLKWHHGSNQCISLTCLKWHHGSDQSISLTSLKWRHGSDNFNLLISTCPQHLKILRKHIINLIIRFSSE